MTEILIGIGVDSLYLLAFINPVSKVSVLSGLSTDDRSGEVRRVASKSSLVAAGILLGSMFFGELLLTRVFHVELHSLRLAGGAVLCWVGLNALSKGIFFESETQRRYEDMAIVPLACPMIAGPATIAACIALRSEEGLLVPSVAIVIAIALNYIAMRLSDPIAAALTRFNILGAIIRITGLIVMTIGTQMLLDGITTWWATSP